MTYKDEENDDEEVHLISNFAVHPVAAIDTHLDKSRWVSKPRHKQLEVSEPNLEMPGKRDGAPSGSDQN